MFLSEKVRFANTWDVITTREDRAAVSGLRSRPLSPLSLLDCGQLWREKKQRWKFGCFGTVFFWPFGTFAGPAVHILSCHWHPWKKKWPLLHTGRTTWCCWAGTVRMKDPKYSAMTLMPEQSSRSTGGTGVSSNPKTGFRSTRCWAKSPLHFRTP